jgi:type III secretory pathway component EscS
MVKLIVVRAGLLARENTMSQELLDLALSKFTQYGINIAKFENTAQGTAHSNLN